MEEREATYSEAMLSGIGGSAGVAIMEVSEIVGRGVWDTVDSLSTRNSTVRIRFCRRRGGTLVNLNRGSCGLIKSDEGFDRKRAHHRKVHYP